MGDQPEHVVPPEDPPKHPMLLDWWKSRLDDIETEVKALRRATVATVATSPGGLPVYAVFYGGREDFHAQANYNSAIAAGNAAHYAHKGRDTKTVVFFLGPVHGQELENIVGTVNLIHILETGRDHRGKDWGDLKSKADQCRIVVVPCGNPDGRRRCPYDSFVGLPHLTMTKYGQGTRRDGTLWGWPWVKAVHPMMGEVGILGCYFNDDGVNPMHDDFFGSMAAETRAILDIARAEAPDVVVSLHSNEDPPFLVQTGSVPRVIGRRILELAERVKARLVREHLPNGPIHELIEDDGTKLPGRYFNLTSAIHHACGAMAFTFECLHGVLLADQSEPIVTHEQILDIQLCLFDEILSYALEQRIYWER